MRYQKLIKEVRLEMSEANLADHYKVYVRARACLLRVQKMIEDQLRGEFENGGHWKVD